MATLENLDNPLNTYPVFEPNQVLTNEHLNRIFSFLDQQNRITRSQLIGMGIICGLEVSLHRQNQDSSGNNGNPTKIHLTAGCGLTSEGYLISTEETDLTHYQPISLTSNDLPGISEEDSVYELLTETEAGNEQDTILLDQPTGNEEEPLPLNDKVVILYLDLIQEKNDSCFNNCDEKGTTVRFKLRRLMVSRTVANKILRSGFKLEDLDLHQAFNRKYSVEKIEIPRFGRADEEDYIDLSQIKSLNDFSDKYEKICNELIENIQNAINGQQNINQVFSPIFNAGRIKLYDFSNTGNQLREKFNEIQTYDLQYFYDYLKDLALAFNEFRDEAFDLMADCCPDTGRFPKHLFSGPLNNDEDELCEPSVFRSHFTQPPIYNGNHHRFKRVEMMYKRLQLMLNFFNLPSPFANFINAIDAADINNTIKITPAPGKKAPLSKRPIPYYFSPDTLKPVWNYDMWKKCDAGNIPSYYDDNNHLLQNLDDKDFFRIEGHIGQNYQEALTYLKNYSKYFNLPYDVIALKLGDGLDYLRQQYEYEFDDLQNLYTALRDELYCLIQDELDVIEQATGDFKKSINAIKAVPLAVQTANNYTDLLKMLRYTLTESLSDFNFNRKVLKLGTQPTQYVRNFVSQTEEYHVEIVRETGIETATLTETFPQDEQDAMETRIQELITYFNYHDPDEMNIRISIQNDEYYYYQLLRDDQEILQSVTPQSAAILAEADYLGFKPVYDDLLNTLEQKKSSSDTTNERLEKLYNRLKCISQDAFRHLAEDFSRRANEIRENRIFDRFAHNHPGMEHLAGVPKGGTFVLVYIDQREAREILSQQLSNIIKDFDNIINKNRLFNEDTNLVIGDFALPYMCCSDKPSLSYVIPRPRPKLLLDQSAFCANDDTFYPFSTEPAGGVVSGPGVVYDDEKKPGFKPSASEIEDGTVTFTYIIDDTMDTLTVTILPVVDVSFDFAGYEHGSVICINPDDNASTSKIELRPSVSGGTFTAHINETPREDLITREDTENGPVYYLNPNAYTFNNDEDTVTIDVAYENESDQGCINTVENSITLAKVPDASFEDISGEYCSTNNPIILTPALNGGGFTVTDENGNEYPEAIEESSDNDEQVYRFHPELSAFTEYNTLKLNITYQIERNSCSNISTQEVVIYQPARASFTINKDGITYNDDGSGFVVPFEDIGPDSARSYIWDFGDGTALQEITNTDNVEHTYSYAQLNKIDNPPTITVTLWVTTEVCGTSEPITHTFEPDYPPDIESGEDDDSSPAFDIENTRNTLGSTTKTILATENTSGRNAMVKQYRTEIKNMLNSLNQLSDDIEQNGDVATMLNETINQIREMKQEDIKINARNEIGNALKKTIKETQDKPNLNSKLKSMQEEL